MRSEAVGEIVRSKAFWTGLLVALVCALLFDAGATARATTAITAPVAAGADVYVQGTISKGAGSFVIDHPLDPANKLLYHSFVESPDAKNIYDGIATLDEKGEATIELPSYFMALNRDYRYLASGLSVSMPDLHIKQEVHKRYLGLFGVPVFSVAGGKPGETISWQVSGTRQDLFIREKPIITEVEKTDQTIVGKGEYLFEGYEATSTE